MASLKALAIFSIVLMLKLPDYFLIKSGFWQKALFILKLFVSGNNGVPWKD
jgi:hypothetical protein